MASLFGAASCRASVRVGSYLLRTQQRSSVVVHKSIIGVLPSTTYSVDENLQRRLLSSAPTPPPPLSFSPPTSLTLEMAIGVQHATSLYLEHGLGRRRLDAVAANADKEAIVPRWQRMMEAFLGTQVHVLAGLGYEASERGIAAYNQHLAALMAAASPEDQESLRTRGRDMWRRTLRTAFDVVDDDDDASAKELTVVEARDMMHAISGKMRSPEILERISKMVEEIRNDDPLRDTQERHTVVQQVLVEDVYLGGEPTSLVEQFGFGPGEKGYVRLQCAMAEHQNDPLVAQYVGGGMQKVMEAAGIDLSKLAQQQQ